MLENNRTIERHTVDGLDNVAYAGLFARFVAFIVDAAIMAFVFFGLLLFTQNVVCVNSPYVKEAKQQYYTYIIDSGLMKYNDDQTSIVPFTYDTYDGYQNLFYQYYSTYLTSEEVPEVDRLTYDENNTPIYWFNTHVLGLKDVKEIYDDLDDLDTLVKETGPELFTYQLDNDGNTLTEVFGLPKCQNNEISATISEEDQAKLIKYFYIPDSTNTNKESYYYSIAILDLTNRNFMAKVQSQYYKHFYTYPILCSFILSALIFYFIIPICAKNGETLGKRMFHLCLANKIGYRYKRYQLIPRFLLPIAVIFISYLVFGFGLWMLGFVTIITLVSYTLSIFTKKHTALHDLVAGTIVVDKVHSEIFDNANDEDIVRGRINEVKPALTNDPNQVRDEAILYKNDNYKNK